MSQNTTIDSVWIDGNFVDATDASESVFAHGLHYGAGVLEGVRFYESDQGPAIFHWEDHLERFFQSARLYKLDIEYGPEELTAATRELVRRNDVGDGYIRPLAYYGPDLEGTSLFDLENCPTRVVLMAWPRSSSPDGEGIDVTTSSWRRMSATQIPTTAKLTGPYASNMLAGLEARRDGYDDAILLNDRGEVAEGATANLFMVRDEELFTPAPAADVLDGITKNAVVELARDLGYDVDARASIGRGELYDADELFLVGTGAEITPVVSVDGMTIGTGSVGPHTGRIRDQFFDVVRRSTDAYDEWFTYV